MKNVPYPKSLLFCLRSFVIFILLLQMADLHSLNPTRIFPIPQQMELTGEEFLLDATVSIVVPEKSSEQDMLLARYLVREMSDQYGIALKIERCGDIPKGRKVVVMGSVGNPLVSQYLSANNIKMSETDPGPEGYLLNVGEQMIVIAGWDDPGAFFGMQSLRQLIYSGNGVKIAGVKVRDWPNLPFRAIRLYVPGPENMAFFKRFLRDFMALYKFNKVVIELNNMRLDNHPEVNAGWIEYASELQYSRLNRTEGPRGELKNSSHYDAGDGFIIEKDDVRELLSIAHQNFIEVIPEIPSLTHCYYLLTRHPELAEYSGDLWPDTYCPSNPATYELMFEVYDEYIEVMQPGMIHIGHDEWRMPLDVCPRCEGKDHSELFARDVRKIHEYMTDRGIQVAMWGDHLLESVRNAGPREGISSTGVKYMKPGALPPSLVMESIPKDILVFNWFWAEQEKDVELNAFGFKQVYGNFKPNISNWKERIMGIEVMGGAPSSWAATTEFNFGKDLMLDFLGCANLLWSSHAINPIDLPGIALELMPSIRARLGGKRIPSEDGDRVEPIDISAHLNLPVAPGIFGVDLGAMEKGLVRYRSKVFNLVDPEQYSGFSTVAVGSMGEGDNKLPVSIKGITIGEDVSSLIFLQASALPSGNQKAYYNIPDFFDTADLLGWYEVIYEDNYRITVPVQYGVNILEWNTGGEKSLDMREGKTGSPQNSYSYESDAVQCASDGASAPITFFAFEWVNPRFGKVIREVNLHGSVGYQSALAASNPRTGPMKSNAIILAGLSVVKKREPRTPNPVHTEQNPTP